MIFKRANPKRVLALDPTSCGLGFVVIEYPKALIDWGVKTIRQDKESITLAKVSELIDLYQPDALVIEDHRKSHRCARINDLLIKIGSLGMIKGVKNRCFSIARVQKVFQTFGAQTKHEIAHVIAQQLPELAARLPRFRKPWMSEDYRMAIFDAAGLALTYFYSQRVRSRNTDKPEAGILKPSI